MPIPLVVSIVSRRLMTNCATISSRSGGQSALPFLKHYEEYRHTEARQHIDQRGQ